MRQQNYETPKENHDEIIIEDEISAQMETHCLSVNLLHIFDNLERGYSYL